MLRHRYVNVGRYAILSADLRFGHMGHHSGPYVNRNRTSVEIFKFVSVARDISKMVDNSEGPKMTILGGRRFSANG